ncbi:hypothetical protein [Acetobacterium wieringae]|uniref:hypothetical protein n=1 Tax=Acetobacterium wieringae TaxID=52694 RepID=UPI0020332294|nr:hypothetical protein [Acetobacterium wieringae]URN84853.1 hypothetical protein CHL1_000439 [Acetobacterium wieringae]
MSKIAGYKDEAYIRGKAPMTKREIRILTISLLGIESGDVVVDIGAGTGGLTMGSGLCCRKWQGLCRGSQRESTGAGAKKQRPF